MPLETVTVAASTDDLIPVPVDDVMVRVFDETGTTFITSGLTGDVTTGIVEFSLDGDVVPVRYQLRFGISGGAIVQPQYIDVYSPAAGSPTGTNNFGITAAMFTLEPASNPRLCRASGYVLGPDGRPRGGIDVHFVPCISLSVVDGYGLLGERVACRSDRTGFISVDLFRTGMYKAVVESREDVAREVVVPDRSSINIFSLLFPRVATIDWSLVAPWTTTVGATLSVIPTITATDFRVLDAPASEDVTYTMTHPEIATVTVVEGAIQVTGVSPGSTTLVVTRSNSEITYIPDLDIDGGVVAVTVS